MQKTITIFIIFIALLAGYVLGNFLPLSLFSQNYQSQSFNLPIPKNEGIQGNARLEVSLEMDDGRPLNNVEVDLAENPGPPPVGGTSLSDQNGLAVFNVKPGNYFIFFNDNNFPNNLDAPEARPIEVKANQLNQEKIIITLK